MSGHSERGRGLTADQVAALVAVTEPWLSCDGCFEAVDVFVDMLVDGADRLEEPLRVHLAGCPACQEEAETLAVLAAQDRGVDTGPVLARLHRLINQPRGGSTA